MKPDELKQRTEAFSLRIIKFVGTLPNTKVTDVLGRQLLRSATSTGANYRAACRARSQADFISKIGVVEEEADESAYWLGLLLKAGLSDGKDVASLLREAEELTAIFTASGRTAKKNSR